jgi:hypothetical protein
MLTKVYPSTINTDLMIAPGLGFENSGIGIHVIVRSQIRDVLWRMDYPMTQAITWWCHD